MTYDVVIIGAGPAGMAAAVQLAAFRASVLIVDEQPSPGGQIWRGVERNENSPTFVALGSDYQRGSDAAAALRGSSAEYMPSTQVWQIEDGWKLYLTTEGTAHRVSARVILLAIGAQERPVPFPGWTLPGVMTVGAAQILLKSGGMLPDGKVWIAGAGPLPLLYATQLLKLGGEIAGYLDTSRRPGVRAISGLVGAWRDIPSLVKGMGWLRDLRASGSLHRGVTDLSADGSDRLQFVNWNTSRGRRREEAGVLLVHEGIVPRIHETLALGCHHYWNDLQRYFAPKLDKWGETSRNGLFVAGDAGGIGGWAAAAVSGEIAALGIVKRLGIAVDVNGLRGKRKLDRKRAKAFGLRPFLDALYPPPHARIPDDVIVCRCEEVTAGTIRNATRSGPPDPSALKAATRCGMGPCQGRQCGYSVQALLAEVHGLPIREVGYFNIRPPLKPVTLGEIASLDNEGPTA